MPVQEATKFQLVINQKTGKALGLTVPSAKIEAVEQREEPLATSGK
jgi:hypothetical protein